VVRLKGQKPVKQTTFFFKIEYYERLVRI